MSEMSVEEWSERNGMGKEEILEYLEENHECFFHHFEYSLPNF